MTPIDDLFAIGSLFFEILSGKRPYDDVDSGTVEWQYKNHEFPSLDSINQNYAKIVDKCWNDRYSSIEDIEDELRPLAKDIVLTNSQWRLSETGTIIVLVILGPRQRAVDNGAVTSRMRR